MEKLAFIDLNNFFPALTANQSDGASVFSNILMRAKNLLEGVKVYKPRGQYENIICLLA